ncbi:MAG TPA: hydrogenase maturation nickel metallochaperone HypA, partial [Thermosynergistes sp.]|nr:hydrogenase maturation nickel metallochaperone HypA [Thermosynergistes sp.]
SRVTLKVGKLRQVVPEVMVFCFEAASKGTPVEGASLEIEEVPLASRCTRCGREWSDSESLGLCPFCGSADVDVVQGMELLLESVEVELDGAEIGRN